jgi:hypothetical protein
MDRPIHRIYLAKFSTSPLPILCSHIDTVLLAGRDDRGYTQDNIANTRGLAVIGADKWFTTISSGKSTITAGTLEQSVGVPLPIQSKCKAFGSKLACACSLTESPAYN